MGKALGKVKVTAAQKAARERAKVLADEIYRDFRKRGLEGAIEFREYLKAAGLTEKQFRKALMLAGRKVDDDADTGDLIKFANEAYYYCCNHTYEKSYKEHNAPPFRLVLT